MSVRPIDCPQCGHELLQRFHGQWCTRCRGWIKFHTRMDGRKIVYIWQGGID